MSETQPGFYRVYSKATDPAGNDEADPLDWYEGAFVVDNTAPALSWATTLPATTDAAAVLAKVKATGTVTTPTGTRNDVTQVYFSVTAPDGTVNYTQPRMGKAWIPLPVANSSTPYTITAVAVDEAGNSTQLSTTVTVTPGTSVVTVTDPADGSAVNTTGVTLHGFVRFASPGTGTIAISGTNVEVNSITLDAQEQFSAWSAQLTLYIENSKSIVVTPTQNSVSGTPATLGLLLDVTAPEIWFIEPNTTVKQFATFSGITSDYFIHNYSHSDVDRVEISVDGGYTWRQATLSLGQYQDNWRYNNWDLGAGQDYASYPVQVRSIDKAGNVVLTRQVITTDDVPPTDLSPVSFSDPVGQHVDQGTTLTVSWNPPVDASGTATVLATVDQVAKTTPTTVISGTSTSRILDHDRRLVCSPAGERCCGQYGRHPLWALARAERDRGSIQRPPRVDRRGWLPRPGARRVAGE